MKLFLSGLLFCTVNCFAQSPATSDEYVQREFTIVSSGTESPQVTRLLIICYNKHFNKNKFDRNFIESNRLDQINYKENMSVEIFLGQAKEGKIVNLKVDKIEENKTQINVYYSYEISKSSELSDKSSPFIIVETPKSKKVVVFYENGAPFKMPGYGD